MIIIEDAEQKQKEFVEFPYTLYKDSAYWVGDLKADTLKLIDRKNHFWDEARRKLFLAYEDGKPIGRIMALVNNVYNTYHNVNIGFFGFFDCIGDPAVAEALFGAACDWLKEQKVTAVRGPANPSSNHTYGLLVDSFDSMPAIMMPYNYPYYMKYIEQNGFTKAMDLIAFRRTRHDKFSPRFEKIVQRATRSGKVKLRRLNLKDLKSEAILIRDIYNRGWAQNWGFVPISEPEIMDMVDMLKWVVRPEGTCVAEIDGKAVGFYIAIPNMNHVLKVLKGSVANPFRVLRALWAWRKIKDARLIMLGVLPEYRSRGIDLILIKHIVDTGVAVWDEAELSWVLESNDAMIHGILESGCMQTKRYRIYEKSL